MTSEEFLDRFPEFGNLPSGDVGEALLDSALAEALLQLDSSVYRDKLDMAHGLLTAHLLAISPYGRSQRTEPGSQETLYWKQFEAVRRQVAPRWIVT